MILNIKYRLPNDDKPKEYMKRICVNIHCMSIVYSPRGSKLKKLTKSRVKQMFECVGKLHQIGVIHRDIDPRHFLLINRDTKDEQVCIILIATFNRIIN